MSALAVVAHIMAEFRPHDEAARDHPLVDLDALDCRQSLQHPGIPLHLRVRPSLTCQQISLTLKFAICVQSVQDFGNVKSEEDAK